MTIRNAMLHCTSFWGRPWPQFSTILPTATATARSYQFSTFHWKNIQFTAHPFVWTNRLSMPLVILSPCNLVEISWRTYIDTQYKHAIYLVWNFRWTIWFLFPDYLYYHLALSLERKVGTMSRCCRMIWQIHRELTIPQKFPRARDDYDTISLSLSHVASWLWWLYEVVGNQ